MNFLIFDFGGTVDTDGIHWCDMFYELYASNGFNFNRDDFTEAFGYAERKMEGSLLHDTSLKETFEKKIGYHLHFLTDKKKYDLKVLRGDIINIISSQCYNLSVLNIKTHLDLFYKLKENYKLALVSNYYGNLTAVCTELTLNEIFDVIVDSAIISVRKPDPGIFLYTIDKLEADAGLSFVIGDSYENDIIPAKSIGCKTIWLNQKYNVQNLNDSVVDHQISSLSQLCGIL